MTDGVAVPEGRVRAELSAFVRTPFGTQCLRIGLAALASAVAAGVICAVLPKPASSSVPPAGQAAGQEPASLATADRQAAPPTTAGFDVAKMWAEQRAQLYAATDARVRNVRSDAWAPAGGLSILMATRFPSAGNVLTADDAKAVPMPMPLPAPVARLGDGSLPEGKRSDASRATAAGKAPAKSAPQLASLPPQAPEPGYFGFFRKLFQGPDHAAKAMLAANPKTAVYDIEKRVVYLPDGDKLEAHSGYGKWMDDPDSMERKNLGVTPPNVYTVSFREKLFHGVRALRMTPVGGNKMYGRDGILAHSYLLGAEGASNGCLSIKDYDKFLQAYEDGAFERIIVVRSADEVPAPAQVASVQPGNS